MEMRWSQVGVPLRDHRWGHWHVFESLNGNEMDPSGCVSESVYGNETALSGCPLKTIDGDVGVSLST